MPRKPESRGTCAYCGETIARRSVPFDKLPEMVALSEWRSGRDVKSVWTANTAKGIGTRTSRKGAKDAKGFVLFAMFRAFRVPMFFVRR